MRTLSVKDNHHNSLRPEKRVVTSIVDAPSAFESPVYVTRPALPPYADMQKHFENLWKTRVLTNSGPKYQQLEEALKKVFDARHVDLFSNGTLALTLALKALDIKGEVITTPFTFPATPHSVVWAGARPVFTDIDPLSLCIDPAAIEAMIGPDTEAILGVHVYGVPCDVDTIQKIADKHGLRVVYDAAHAFNVSINGNSITSFGDATMFSFHATKLFHTIEGGALAYKDADLKDKLGLLKNFGIKDERTVMIEGINAKLNEVQCAFGLEMLKEAEKEILRRRRLREIYIEHLSQIEGIVCVVLPENVTDSMQYMVIRVDEQGYGMSADRLCDELKQYNIFARRYFYPLCTEYECYLDARKSTMDVAERVVDEVLCMPFYGELGIGDVEKIIDTVKYLQAVSK